MDNQTKALLIRVFPILFFLGLIGPKDRYVLFHSNQALLHILVSMGSGIIGMIPIIGGIIGFIAGIFSLYVWIIGIVSVCKKQMRPMPFIGHYNLIG